MQLLYRSLAFVIVGIMGGQSLAQKIDPEAVLRSYWVANERSQQSFTAATPEQNIMQLHNSIIAGAYPNKGRANEKIVLEKSGIITKAVGEYSRVTCSETSCEVVVSYPKIASDGREASKIVSDFNENVTKKANIFKIVGPTVITESEKGNRGLTILTYISII